MSQSHNVEECFSAIKDPIAGAVYSLEPGGPSFATLPSPNIPNAIWRVISSTVPQNYFPSASALLFDVNNLIAATCPGPYYCPTADSIPPEAGDILGDTSNDAIVTLPSQTAECVEPSCQVATFNGLAHTRAPSTGSSIEDILFDFQDVKDDPDVIDLVACWLSTNGDSSCIPSTQQASSRAGATGVARGLGLISKQVRQVDRLEVKPPRNVELAVPFDLA